ncbi:MAG: hypothetical protein JWL91_137 [Sphingomonas bacterium]|nr:hypothetical protein [Sphingomonas bacterium]MDB5688261.1 hypothetical protein [Sphingomonas bacterium]
MGKAALCAAEAALAGAGPVVRPGIAAGQRAPPPRFGAGGAQVGGLTLPDDLHIRIAIQAAARSVALFLFDLEA